MGPAHSAGPCDGGGELSRHARQGDVISGLLPTGKILEDAMCFMPELPCMMAT